jgi:hypothetical protein
MVAMRNGLTQVGPPNTTIPIFENLMDSRTLMLTANCNTPYIFGWITLHDGPVVLELPPMVLGVINDFWSQYIVDLGLVGPDKGKGGKCLLLPPGYKGDAPEGYFVVQSTTFEILYAFRIFAADGDVKKAVGDTKQITRIYLLSQADNPPANKIVNVSGKEICTLFPSDYTFWDNLNTVVQGEPCESFDRVSLGYFASIGIEKGKPFAPDARMKKILTEAAQIGNATTRAISYKMREKENYFYENSAWRNVFLGNYKFENQPNVLNLDGYISLYFGGIGVTPAEEIKIIGKGSQYVWAFMDENGNQMDGSKNYRLHLPAGIPAKDFWSVIMYDVQTRSMLQTDQQFPMVSSQNEKLNSNPDKSVDIYFGPEAPKGMEDNWIQTIPGKGWFIMLRMYGPLEPWFDKTWRPGEIELMK